jgi:hypothetical protein
LTSASSLRSTSQTVHDGRLDLEEKEEMSMIEMQISVKTSMGKTVRLEVESSNMINYVEVKIRY